jgi:arginyl-tRNA synthetase
MDHMNVFELFTAHVRSAVEAIAAEGVFASPPDLARIVVEPPREAGHGDLATNAAMALAKDAGLKPRDLAERIAAELRKRPEIAAVEIAGPGFINMTLDPGVWREALRSAIVAGPEYGRSDLGNREKVNVEYVSANPTGPMHVGHCRGAVYGDALANLLAFTGHAVTREYYVNDAGAQVDVLARSAYLRYREALGDFSGVIPEGLYPGEYLKPVGEALKVEYGRGLNQMPEDEWLPIVRAKATNMMMAEIRKDLSALSINHDVFFYEHTLIEGSPNKVTAAIEELRAKEEVYDGRLPPPKGAPVEDWEDRVQTLFKSTDFGDDIDRPLMKSDGSYTYFATDIAYHKDKLDRGFRKLIDVWGADHGGYIKRMQAAVDALSDGQVPLIVKTHQSVNVLGKAQGGKDARTRAKLLDVELIQLVKLLRDGEPVKMSKRAGDFVTLREVVDEVGSDAVRFMMLYRKNDAPLDFDLVKVKEQSRDNPVFYVQYGHARGHSIFRNAREEIPDLPEHDTARAAMLAGANFGRLDDPAEIALMRRIALYPRLIESAAGAHEPHRVAFYLYELASEFHALWTKGKDLPYLRFIIQNDPELTRARLALVQGVVTVLASGLGLLGVGAPVEMR